MTQFLEVAPQTLKLMSENSLYFLNTPTFKRIFLTVKTHCSTVQENFTAIALKQKTPHVYFIQAYQQQNKCFYN